MAGSASSVDASPYARLARFVLAHRRGTWLVTGLITVLAVILGFPPKIDANLLNLLPDSDPSVTALKRINDEEGGLNVLSLTYRADDPDVLDAVLDELAGRFEAMDTVDFAMHEVDPDLARQVGMLQFEASEIRELNTRLRGALALGPSLNPLVTQRLMAMGPLTEKIQRAGDNPVLGASDDGQARLIVRPTESSADPLFNQRFMAEVDALLAEVDPAARGVELVWMGGAYRHNVEDVEGIRHDLAFTSVVSGTFVLLIMALAFRTPRAIAIVFPPLLLANVVVLATVSLAYGALNTYTSFGTAILLGLGIDFAVHLVGRYREIRGDGAEVEDAIAEAWARTGPPCTTAALTSAAGFLALATAEFVGFAQLGVLLAVGLLVCLTAMLVLLPLLLSWLDRDPPESLVAPQGDTPSTSSYRFSLPGSIVLAVLTVAVAAWALPRLEYEYDISNLRREGLSYQELSEEERALARQSYSPVVVFFDGADEDALVAAQARADEAVAGDGVPHLRAAISRPDVLPPDQADRNEALRELVGLLEHPNLRYVPRVLVERLLPLRGTEIAALSDDDLPPFVRLLLGDVDAGKGRLLLIPTGNLWDVREGRALAAEVEGLFPDQEVASEYIGISSMFMLAVRDAPQVAVVALVFVVLLSWWDLRRIPWVLGAVGTLVAGLLWASGVVVLGGVKLTMVNLTGIPILLGIGVDVVIHLLHRIEEEGPGGIRRSLRTTGVAAGLSTLTTVGSFVSLALAQSRSIQSLGTLVVFGLTTVFVVTAVLLPTLWTAGWRLRGKAPAQG